MDKKLPGVLCSFLALWLISSPFIMGYPSRLLFLSDLISGGLLLVLSIIHLLRAAHWIIIGMGLIGLWLTFAPLLFWAPDAASAANNTLIGSLIITVAFVIPSLMRREESLGSENPPDWSYNPSSWSQRLPIILLAVLGFLFARYLSAFQLGHIPQAWDPFFGKDTEKILTSDISRWFPVSDAGLGAWSYLLDALAGAIGGVRRWKSMPWVVILFGLLIIPSGVTSITLVILQPIGVGAWCTICLLTAVIMLLMVPPALDEILATVEVLQDAKRRKTFWKTFWYGVGEDFTHSPRQKVRSAGKLNIAWTQWLLVLVGSWSLYAPAAFSLGEFAANLHYFSGALIITIAVIAASQAGRPARFLNTFMGLIVMVFSLLPPLNGVIERSSLFALGFLTLILSLPRGAINQHFGKYDPIIYWSALKRR